MHFFGIMTFLMTSMLFLWISRDLLLASYALVKGGPNPISLQIKTHATLSVVFLMTTAQAHSMYYEEMQTDTHLYWSNICADVTGGIMVIAIITHVVVSWKKGKHRPA